ncbi:MAG: type IV pilus modification protein PilV [Oleibacter sp.]|nr:type IV pilus modification protein PilV [Thalassolituus sp.]
MSLNRLIPVRIAGFSMIEILVTLAITTIGLVGLASLQLQATKSTSDAGSRSQAIWMLEDLGNRIRANSTAYDSYSTGGGAFNCGGGQPKICSSYNNGAASITADLSCTSQEQAASDIWEVACGTPANINGRLTRSSAADFLANPQLVLTTGAIPKSVTATLSWDVRTSGVDSDGNAIYAVTNDGDVSRSSITMVFYP